MAVFIIPFIVVVLMIISFIVVTITFISDSLLHGGLHRRRPHLEEPPENGIPLQGALGGGGGGLHSGTEVVWCGGVGDMIGGDNRGEAVGLGMLVDGELHSGIRVVAKVRNLLANGLGLGLAFLLVLQL